MKAEKLIKLVVNYEHINISENWVAFSLSRTLENTYNFSGIVDRKTWNDFEKDPFSVIPTTKAIRNGIVMVKNDFISKNPNFDIVVSGDNHNSLVSQEHNFSYSLFKENPTYSILKLNSIGHMAYETNNLKDFNYLTDLDNKVVYFEMALDLPYITQSQGNRERLANLHDLIKNHSQFFEIIPSSEIYDNKKEMIEAFEYAIHCIDNPYIPRADDFSSPTPEFTSAIGSLRFNIPGFKDYDDFFQLTKKYIEVDSFGISKKRFGLVIVLALLKSHYNDLIHNDLYEFFPEENKLADCISLDYKLKPKENILNPKKKKI